MSAAPIICITSSTAQFSFGLGRPGRWWGDSSVFVERLYLLNASFSRSIGARAITVIIGPLYLQLGWRAA